MNSPEESAPANRPELQREIVGLWIEDASVRESLVYLYNKEKMFSDADHTFVSSGQPDKLDKVTLWSEHGEMKPRVVLSTFENGDVDKPSYEFYSLWVFSGGLAVKKHTHVFDRPNDFEEMNSLEEERVQGLLVSVSNDIALERNNRKTWINSIKSLVKKLT